MSQFRVQGEADTFFSGLNQKSSILSLSSYDSRSIPLVVAGFTLAIQVVLIVASACNFYFLQSDQSKDAQERPESASSFTRGTHTSRLQKYVQEFGGIESSVLMLSRLSGCVTLLGLSARTVREWCVRNNYEWTDLADFFAYCPEATLLVTYAYTSLLSFISLVSKRWRVQTTRSIVVVLLSAFVVYSYRDIWPLATFDQQPEDFEEGMTLWIKFAILGGVAVIIPLFMPRLYVPVDPKNSIAVANPEQTASLFSLITFVFLDNIIRKGYKLKHLSERELPALADYDDTSYLSERGFPRLDVFSGAKRRHIFFGLMQVFAGEYIFILLTIIVRSFAGLMAPIGINRVLHFLESRGESQTIRPCFWILWLFFGPMTYSLVSNLYEYASTTVLVRAEAIITELVFEHSLRIRVKADAVQPGESETSGSMECGSHSQETTMIASREVTTAESGTEILQQGDSDSATTPIEPNSQEKKHSSAESNFTGRLNNLVTSDLQAIADANDFLEVLVAVPLQIILSVAFLYAVLGWSVFVFMALTLTFMLLPGYVTTLIGESSVARTKATDARVQAVTEAVHMLRMIKLFGWEEKTEQHIQEKREDELRVMWRLKSLQVYNSLMGYFIPTLTMVITYATYVILMKENLTPSKIFSSMPIFSILRDSFQRLMWQSNSLIQGKISLDRVGEFLQNTELLDVYSEELEATQRDLLSIPPTTADLLHSDVGFGNALFTWSREDAERSANQVFKLRIDGEVFFKRGKINLITGPTGSGKTSVLMALLGEMHFVSAGPDSWFNLPRDGGVAYAAQESWVLNDTIRSNILFESPYEAVRYQKVIKQCALERDLELFEAGDQTEVGERGLTLSGGQKARITLARAVYSSANILLLDDILAALDVHTCTWIVDQCFRGDLIKGRTILLVTHNVALASPIAEFILALGRNGRVQTQGTELSLNLSRDNNLDADNEKNKEATEITEDDIQETDEAPTGGKLIVEEEFSEGHVSLRAWKLLLNALGGDHPILFFALCIGGFLATEVTITTQTWFLGYWGSQYEVRHPSQVNFAFYLSVYSALLTVTTLLFSAAYLYYSFATIRSARTINNKLIDSILWSTLRWLDQTPTGRIIVRCTQDVRTADAVLPQWLLIALDCINGLVIKLGAIILFTPIFFFPGLVVALLGLLLGNIYQKAQLSVSRESSNARAPVLSHFSASMHGLVSLRAYGAQNSFKAESRKRINHYTRLIRVSSNLNRWVAVRMDALGALFSGALAFYLVYGQHASSVNTGFTLNMTIEFTRTLLFMVEVFNSIEAKANSLERIQAYIDIDHEPKPTLAGKPPAAWPTSGDLRVENISARYSEDGPNVLHGISFHAKSGERIGIVGRTGSGKSSLTLALLRGILTEGAVYYDGLATDSINLDALRSNITIIPQIPELLSGTLRHNVDPLEQTDDANLNDALRDAGLFSLQEEAGEGRLNMDTQISAGGGNLSVGQRQIIALARAMIRGSKILILDEATSAIDYDTDAIIQATLRERLDHNVTVLTIAHRLQTIMDYDRILVLDNGRVVEFDAPSNLLKKENGILKSLVDGSKDKAALYALARK